MKPLSDFAGSRILIAIPCYGGMVTASYTRSVLELIVALGSQRDLDIGCTLYMQGEESLVTRARIQIAEDFLQEPTFTHLFWIDADIGLTSHAAVRLLCADRDVAGRRSCFVEQLRVPPWSPPRTRLAIPSPSRFNIVAARSEPDEAVGAWHVGEVLIVEVAGQICGARRKIFRRVLRCGSMMAHVRGVQRS
jgi:hypothetical protein